MTTKATTLIAILLFAIASISSHAQDFSANVVYLDTNAKAPAEASPGASHAPSRLYVSGDKMRLETNGLTGTVLLSDRHEHTALALKPARKSFESLGSGPSQYFRVDNPEDACPTWQSIAEQKIICEKVGPESVNGRETVKYKNKSVSEMAISAVWIDKTLKFVIKWQSAGVGAELRDIKEGQLAADLFAVPANYKPAGPQRGNPKGFAHK